jgi:hypothetical protein
MASEFDACMYPKPYMIQIPSKLARNIRRKTASRENW